MSSEDNWIRRIHEAHENGVIEIGIGEVQLNRPGSPVYSWTDHNLPGLILLIAIALFFYFTNWKWGLLSVVCGFVLLLWPIRVLGFSRLRRRTLKYVLSDWMAWQQLWEIGALSMRLTANPVIYAKSPRDSWIEFARSHLLVRQEANLTPMDAEHHGFRAVPLIVGIVQIGIAISLVLIFGSNLFTLPIGAVLVWLGVTSIRIALTGSQRLVDEMTQSQSLSAESFAECTRHAGVRLRERTTEPARSDAVPTQDVSSGTDRKEAP